MKEKQTITSAEVGSVAGVLDPTAENSKLAVVVPGSTALANIDYANATEQFQDEFDQSSLSIPFLRTIQSNSPELDPAEGKYIEGARVGMLLNTATREVFAGFDDVVPVLHHATFIEFKIRENGGGFVKDHGLQAGNALLPSTKKDEKGRDILPNGNQLQRTEVYFVFAIRENGQVDQMMFTMTSTQLKKARQWNSKAKSLKTTYPDGSITPRVGSDGISQIPTPLYANSWKLKTVQESNDKGKWYGYVLDFNRPTFQISEAIFAQAIEFRKVAAEGLKQGAVNLSETAEPVGKDDVPF